MNLRDLRIVLLLAVKSLKVIFRQKSVRTLSIVSSTFVFGSLLAMYAITYGQTVSFLSSRAYDSLAFTYKCVPAAERGFGSRNCHPIDDPMDEELGILTPSDLVYMIFKEGGIDSDSKEAKRLSTLLSSIIMNGLPIVGIDDYILLSDLASTSLSKNFKAKLTKYSVYKDKFGNFLDVRKNELRFANAKSCITQAFLNHVSNTTYLFNELNVKQYGTMEEALDDNCCNAVWSIIEIVPAVTYDYTEDDQCSSFNIHNITASPKVTIRMHPSALPDTRNFEWTPLKKSLARTQSGQLLYFISGFLTLQVELQNFFGILDLGGSVLKVNIQKAQEELITQPSQKFADVVSKLSQATKKEHVENVLLNSTSTLHGKEASMLFPMYHRAFPTRLLKLSSFYHSFGALISSMLTIYFCLPGAMIAAEFNREKLDGQLDVLSTLPHVFRHHSVIAWLLCGVIWAALISTMNWMVFLIIFRVSSPSLPSFGLFLFSLTVVAVALIMGKFVTKPEALVVTVPICIFITMLPGTLYYELTYDVQKSTMIEMILCLFPGSAMALIISEICMNEAANIAVGWNYVMSISHTPVAYYIIMLVVDVVVYTRIALLILYDGKKSYLTNSTPDEPINNVSEHERGQLDYEKTLEYRNYSTSYRLLLKSWEYMKYPFKQIYHWIRGDQLYSILPANNRNSSNSSGMNQSTHHGFSGNSNITPEPESEANFTSTGQVRTASLNIWQLTKEYTTAQVGVVVLSNLSTNLYQDCVTVLLGSNGAGKTTLMKILGGLDNAYRGKLRIEQQQQQQLSREIGQATNIRQIGWCPQNDPLYTVLTVQEHLELFQSIVSMPEYENTTDCMSSLFQTNAIQLDIIDRSLRKLGMIEHRHKRVLELSGGMKRRLSLSLAFLGNPHILLLDEPTSGCDAWTRELIRKDILSRKKNRSILVSTHHTDDIEVLADRVWFLNERYLEFDGSMNHLASMRSKNHMRLYNNSNSNTGSHNDNDINHHYNGFERQDSNEFVDVTATTTNALHQHTSDLVMSSIDLNDHSNNSNSNRTKRERVVVENDIEFTTWDPVIKEKFTQHFGRDVADDWAVKVTADNNNNANTTDSNIGKGELFNWSIPSNSSLQLKQFVQYLESHELRRFNVYTTHVYDALCKMYDQGGSNSSSNNASSDNSNREVVQKMKKADRYNLFKIIRQIRALLWIRSLEVKNTLGTHIFIHLFLPFFVALLVVLSCRDVAYPATELTSKSFGGYGEVSISKSFLDTFTSMNINGNISITRRLEEEKEPENNSIYAHHRNLLDNINDNNNNDISSPIHHSGTNKNSLDNNYDYNYEGHLNNSCPNVMNRLNDVNYAFLIPCEYRYLFDIIGHNVIRWEGYLDSTGLFQRMWDTYFHYTEPRRAAFVLQDTMTNWISINMILDQDKAQMSILDLYDQLALYEQHVCNTTQDLYDRGKHNKYYNASELSPARDYVDKYSDTTITFCNKLPGVTATLRNTSYEDLQQNLTASYHIEFNVYESLISNLTMMTNITSYHASPVYLKELAPIIFNNLNGNNTYNASSYYDSNNIKNRPKSNLFDYTLYTHPLPEVNLSNDVYIARGFLGSTIVMLLMLLNTVGCVRFITNALKTGVKQQFHLSGIHPITYWIGNFIFDGTIIAITISMVLLAIMVGGNPIQNYYFLPAPYYGFISLWCIIQFSFSITAGCYACCVLAKDELSSQLVMIISTTTIGGFMKIFFHRYNDYPLNLIEDFIIWISPCFAFSSAIYNEFQIYTSTISNEVTGKLVDVAIEWTRLHNTMWIMAMHSAVYLTICICIDIYWNRIQLLLSKLYWHYRAQFVFHHEFGGIEMKHLEHHSLLPDSKVTNKLHEQNAQLFSGNDDDENERFSIHGASNNRNRKNIVNSPIDDDGDIELQMPKSSSSQYSRISNTSDIDNNVSNNSNKYKTPLIEAKELCVEYNNDKRMSLNNLSLNIPSESRIALMGANGGGKSTLFKTLTMSNHIVPSHGYLKVNGYDSVKEQWYLGSQNNHIGYVPQEGGLLEYLTVEQALKLYSIMKNDFTSVKYDKIDYSSSNDDNIISKKYFPYPIHALSGGTKKKLFVKLANIGSPSLLLLDECTTGVDPIASERIIKYLKTETYKHQGILFASHRIEESIEVCNRILMLVSGQSYLDGTIHIFHDLANKYYQVDIVINLQYYVGQQIDSLTHAHHNSNNHNSHNSNSNNEHDTDEREAELHDQFIAHMMETLGGSERIERIVSYSHSLIRITIEKQIVPLSQLWNHLLQWKQQRKIEKYSFRLMEMEEVLSSILSSSNIAVE